MQCKTNTLILIAVISIRQTTAAIATSTRKIFNFQIPIFKLSLPAIPEFVVGDFLKVDRAAKVSIDWIGGRFTEQFGGQIEPPTPEATLLVRTLGRDASAMRSSPKSVKIRP